MNAKKVMTGIQWIAIAIIAYMAFRLFIAPHFGWPVDP
jgi:hypothetical protein